SKGCATQPSYSGATYNVGTATLVNQSWQSTNENEACYWTCGLGKVLLGNDCVSENCSGTTPDGTTKLSNATSVSGGTWNYNTTPGICTYSCNTGYHTEDAGESCISDTQSCVIANGTGSQTWNGTGWNTCTVTSCDANYVQSGNTCVLDTSWCAYGSTAFTNALGWTDTELRYDSGTNKCYVFGDENTNAQNACNKWITDNVTLGGSWIWVPARNFITDGHGTDLKDTFYQREVTYNDNTYVCRGFAVMKYEAKFTSTSGKSQPDPTGWATWATSDYATDNDTFPETINSGITSKVADNPIAYIRQGEAIDACKGSTSNQYHLITNNEWMALARNIEAQSVNLKDGNKLYRGLDGGNGQNGEDGTLGCGKTGGQTTYWTAPAGTDNNSLSSTRSSCDDMRQNKLSNGSIVWDISGNVWEHVNKSNVANTSNSRTTNSGWNTNAYSTEAMCSNGTWAWRGWNGTDAQSITACTMIGGYTQASYGPFNNWNADNGVGRIYANNTEDRDNVFLRGAGGANGARSGLFTMYLDWDAMGQYDTVGFRCSW
ncbi:MAG: hypothetical protein Q8K30_05890, partial [Candidatus Gracilibacteria bacterium]|nr:hypothetical protein [Candidatus Gracilibacteria bacterium]